MKNNERKSQGIIAGQEVKELLKTIVVKSDLEITAAENAKRIQELEQRQAELVVQNEALRLAALNAREAAKKITDLYDFAPSGYFAVSKVGNILDLNPGGEKMLQKDRSEIISSRFNLYVSSDTKPIFYIFLEKIFNSTANETCEISLCKNGNLPTPVLITGIADANGQQCYLTVVDISGRILMNGALLKNNQRYQTLAEVAPVGIFHTDATGYTTYVNPSWCQITGLSEEEGLGNNWLKAVHEEDRNELISGWQDAVKIKETSFSEYRFIRSDGSIAWVMGQAIPEKNSDNEVLGYVGTITDITERKLIEERQQQNQEFLKEAQLIANLGTYSLDIVGGKWTCSEVLENIFGINGDFEKIFENWSTLIHPDWQKRMNDYFIEEVVGNKTKFDKEYKIIRINDKAERWVHGLGGLKFNGNNEPITLVGTIQDITDRKQMEIELTNAKERAEESNSKFRNYVENAPDGVFVTNEFGIFLEVNPAATSITGFSKEDLLTMSIKDLAAPDILEATLVQLHLLLETGLVKEDAKFIHKNGEIRWMSVEAVKLSEHQIIAFVKDITESKQAAEEIKKSKERFELIANATNDGLWDWNTETNKVWGNEMHQQLYGLTLADPVPNYEAWVQRIHPNDRERIVTALENAKDSGAKSHIDEYRFCSENAGWMNVYGRTLIQRNEEGKPVRLIGSMIDISVRKKTEDELLKSKQQFQSLVENISGVYWVNDLETYQTLYISPSYETIWGRKSEDLYNNPADFINAVHPDDKPLLYEAHKNIIHTSVMNISYRIVRPDGAIRWISAKTNVVVNAEGRRIEYGYAEDVTESKKAEEALQNAEKRLQFLLSSTPAVIYSSHVEFPFAATFISENIIEQTGYKQEDFMDDPNFWSDHIHPEDKQRVLADLVHLFESGYHTHEYRFRLKNGNYLWMYDELKLIFDDTGKPLEVVGYWINIDERKQAEEAIKASEEKYRTLVEQASDAILIADNKGRFMAVNTSLCKLSQYSENELLHMTLSDLAITDHFLENSVTFKELKEGKTVISERIAKGKKGKALHVEINAKLLTDGRLLAFVRDIAERKKNQRALAESENRLRSIYNAEPECIKLLGPKGELMEMNPAGLSMIEADGLEQVKGKSVLGIVNEPYQKLFQDLIKNCFKGKPGTLEFEITTLKGTVRWLDTHAVPLKDTKGKIISLLGVTRDITESKKTREKIKNTTEQLRQLTAHLQSIREEERKRIGREIHDELGQQLTAIKMDVVWIDKKIPEETTALKTKLKNIIGLLDGSNQSIRRILSELRPVILDDHGLIEAMEWLGRQFTANTGIAVKFTCTETEIKATEPIATCIFRVYQEAFTNITRHAKANTVATSLRVTDGNIAVMIADDGKGFKTESVQNNQSFGIFGMKERVLSLNGKFELISSSGKGTKIIITLPYANYKNS